MLDPLHKNLPLVSVESPYSPGLQPDKEAWDKKLQANITYARLCMMDSIMRGEAPFLSHLLYTQVLDDEKVGQRLAGLAMGHAWRLKCELIAVYVDHGISAGMADAIALAQANNIPVEERRLYN